MFNHSYYSSKIILATRYIPLKSICSAACFTVERKHWNIKFNLNVLQNATRFSCVIRSERCDFYSSLPVFLLSSSSSFCFCLFLHFTNNKLHNNLVINSIPLNAITIAKLQRSNVGHAWKLHWSQERSHRVNFHWPIFPISATP